MAQFIGTARTNYFEVQNLEQFTSAINELPDIRIIHNGALVGLVAECPDSGMFPSFIYNESLQDYEEIDLADIVSNHLKPSSVAIFMWAGAEKTRYVSGSAVAINSEGETQSISLSNIYEMAKSLGDNITLAEY